ncbi:hypothetical protein KGF54_000812 [Candida jiufengensis]|uniref:uncharacterized protein n=1 Tax=Candida jiufengensis TaxID=497108 RepID=UPI0022243A7B|nr:uncharacterized protein KGF54_000812 [Candida jiufengensis]KAI5956337.1 hypothetical protein KGF54_000812 [Candida jiufengensis]
METDDYINTNFTNIDDLNNLDSKLQQLNQLVTRINQVATNKLSNNTGEIQNNQQVEEPKVDESQLSSTIDLIETQLREIAESNDLNTNIFKIDQLIQEYGSYHKFIILKSKLQNKLQIQNEIEHLTKVSNIEKQLLSNNLSVKHLIEINNRSVELNDYYLNNVVDEQIDKLRLKLQTNLKDVIQKNKWLNNDTVSNAVLTSITSLFSELIQLQSIKNIPDYPNTWWGLETLLDPIILKFNYHFDTPKKDTNKLSKPEWCLQYIETFLDDNLSLINIIVDPSFRILNKIGTYENITCLLIPIRTKINKMIQIINKNINEVNTNDNATIEKYGRLLTHLIYEVSSFDQRLRNKYKYNPNVTNYNETTNLKWTGIAGDIFLDNENKAFENWLNFENKLAIKRYQNEIINKEDSFKIDYDYHTTSNKLILKPTYSSYGFIKLMNNLNSHLQQIRVFKFNMKYISKIQLNLLDLYLNEINKQFKMVNDKLNIKNVLNIIPGGISDDKSNKTTTNQESESLKNLENLLEVYCSTKYAINQMEQWSEEFLFIQLWDKYKSLNKEAKVQEVRDYYYNNNNADDQDDGIFGSFIIDYEKLLIKTTNQIKKELLTLRDLKLELISKSVSNLDYLTFTNSI